MASQLMISGKRGLRKATYIVKEKLLWRYYLSGLREPKTEAPVLNDPQTQAAVRQKLIDSGINVVDYAIDVGDYHSYLAKADYGAYPYYDHGRGRNFPEKSLEHYLSAVLLGLSSDDVYIDVASDRSPVPEIFSRVYQCESYRQDLSYPNGLNGCVIGGDAANMPVPDGFATKMAMHCSFEHFEQDADIRFVKEAARVLKAAGKLCIIPLYLANEFAVYSNPVTFARGADIFDKDAVIHVRKGWRQRHGRFYDPEHLVSRIGEHLGQLDLTVYFLKNEKEVDPSCYIKFVAILQKG